MAHPSPSGPPGPAGEEAAERTTRDAWLAAAVICAATLLAYSNSFDAAFQLDDEPNIVSNPRLRDLGALWPPSGSRWVGLLTFAINYRVGGLDVFGYHLVNFLVHLTNALLLHRLTALTLRTPALRSAGAGPLLRRHLPLAAALLFAVHPLATQAVTYIVQRFTSLATLFFLLALALHAQARLAPEGGEEGRAGAGWLHVLSFLSAIAAMRTKEIAVTLPMVAAAYEILFFRTRRPALLLPLVAAAALVPLGRLADVGVTGGLLSETPKISRWDYLLTQSRVVVLYLRLLVLPVGQNVDHDVPLSTSPAEPAVLGALAILLGIAGIATFALLRSRRANRAAGSLFFFGVTWFFATLSVESSIIPIRDVAFEHRVYLPSAGATVALATVLLCAAGRVLAGAPVARQAAFALVLTALPLAAATHARNRVWKDEVTLWTDAMAKSPGKERPRIMLGAARLQLGLEHARRGELDRAEREYREAIRVAPELAQAHANLGVVLVRQGRAEEGLAEHRRAFEIEPIPENAMNLAMTLEATHRLEEAAAMYQRFVDSAGDRHPEGVERARRRIARIRGGTQPR